MKHWLTLEQYREAKGVLPEGAIGVRHHMTVQVKAADDDSLTRVIMSNENKDRDGDTISVRGWKLDHFKKNPVLLFVHDSRDLPIGKVAKIFKDLKSIPAALIGDLKFTPEDLNPLGETVRRMFKEGFMNAVSVGFRPIKFAFREISSELGFGIDFIEQELLELSAVPVPAHPEALVLIRSAGIDLAPIKTWAEQFLEGELGEGLWIPRAQVEAVHKILSDKPFIDLASQPSLFGMTEQSDEYREFFNDIELKGEDDDTPAADPPEQDPPAEEPSEPAEPKETPEPAEAPPDDATPTGDTVPSAAPVGPVTPPSEPRAFMVNTAKDGGVNATVDLAAGEVVRMGPLEFTVPESGTYVLAFVPAEPEPEPEPVELHVLELEDDDVLGDMDESDLINLITNLAQENTAEYRRDVLGIVE